MRTSAGKAMNLPHRLEGPHNWMWRLLYRQADRLVSSPGSDGSRDEAADWLWSGVQRGWLWIRRDRTGLAWDAPDPWLHDLVEAEAESHLALSDHRLTLAPAGPAQGEPGEEISPEPSPRPRDERRSVIEGHIWRYLASGWARIADDEDRILFWHPDKRQFMPFSAELEADYRRLFRSFRRLAKTVERRRVGSQPYTGRGTSRTIPEDSGAYLGPRARRRGPSSPRGGTPPDDTGSATT